MKFRILSFCMFFLLIFTYGQNNDTIENVIDSSQNKNKVVITTEKSEEAFQKRLKEIERKYGEESINSFRKKLITYSKTTYSNDCDLLHSVLKEFSESHNTNILILLTDTVSFNLFIDNIINPNENCKKSINELKKIVDNNTKPKPPNFYNPKPKDSTFYLPIDNNNDAPQKENNSTPSLFVILLIIVILYIVYIKYKKSKK